MEPLAGLFGAAAVVVSLACVYVCVCACGACVRACVCACVQLCNTNQSFLFVQSSVGIHKFIRM